jgi:uncharacterized membrane protein YhaH (DUF805 family)
MTSFLQKIIFLTVIIFIFLFIPHNVKASCVCPDTIIIMSCHNGVCIDGFEVDNIFTGNYCETRPILNKNRDDLNKQLSITPYEEKQKISTGIYKITTSGELEKLSDSTDNQILEQYKSEWQNKEIQGIRRVAMEKLTGISIPIAIVLLAVLWPWIFIRKKRFSQAQPPVFFFAIIMQILLALYFLVFGFMSPGPYAVIQIIYSISIPILLISIMVEIIYLIYKKIRKNNK